MTTTIDDVVRIARAATLSVLAAWAATTLVSAWRVGTSHVAVVATASFEPEPFGDGG